MLKRISSAYSADLSLIPLAKGKKTPALKSWKEYQKTRPSLDVLKGWFENKDLNYAIVCGEVSGNIFVLDVEEDSAALDLLGLLFSSGHHDIMAILNSTYCIRTANGGRHYYLRCDDITPGRVLAYANLEEGKTGQKKPPLIETRAEGNYVVGEGSKVHGATYTLIHGEICKISEITPEGCRRLFAFCAKLCKKMRSETTLQATLPAKKPSPQEDDCEDVDEDDYPYLKWVLSHFPDYTREKNGWNATCCAPGHGGDGVDSRPSLRITVGDDGKIVLYCRAGCSSRNVAYGAGLDWRRLYPPPGERPAPNLMAMSKPIMDQDQTLFAAYVYTTLLEKLGLSTRGHSNLLRRGLNRAQVESLGYKTYNPALPRDLDVIQKLYGEFGAKLLEVPGFVPGKLSPMALALPAEAILVPIRHHMGMVMALKGRFLHNIGKKFKLLADGGAGSLCQKIHFPLGYPREIGEFRVTEGEMKADIATALSGLYTIGCPGVQSLATPIEFLSHFSPGARIVLAPDFADLAKNGVADRVLAAIYFYQNAGFTVFLEAWKSKNLVLPKGIDDALSDGADITEIPAEDAVQMIEYLKTRDLNDDYLPTTEN